MPPEALPPPDLQGAGKEDLRIEANPSPAVWESYVRDHPDASLFHGTAWQRVLERTFKSYQPCHRLAWRGDRVAGVLPLYRVPGFPSGRALISSPLGVYGGICADDSAAATALLEDATALAREIQADYVELRQERPLGDLPTKELYVYFRRELRPDREAILLSVPGKQRRPIRLSETHGLTHRIGREDLLTAFYNVYSENMRNLGSPGFPRRLFQAMLEEYGSQCMILGVFLREEMVAGVFTFYYRDRLMPYYAASTPKGLSVSANNYMYLNLMCHGAERGLQVFDFGRSKKDSGSYHYKRHWGFDPIPLPYQYQLVGTKEIPNLSPANPKYALAIKAWRRMPLRFTQWLGPKLSTFFP